MFKFGIEYTFVGKTGALDDRDTYNSAVTKIKKSSKSFKETHIDGHIGYDCVEVPSPVHRTLREAKSFYNKLVKEVGKHGLTPLRIDETEDELTYHGTGGGHIHVELSRDKKLRLKTMYNLVQLVAQYPLLSWVFNEWSDNDNARPLLTVPRIKAFTKGEPCVPINFWHCTSKDDPMVSALCSLVNSKTEAIRFKHQPNDKDWTVEYRFFDAPTSWDQTREHIEFAQALTIYAVDLSLVGRTVDLHEREDRLKAQYLTRHYVETSFKSLVEKIGLSWAKYKKYMKNFDDREEFGELF